ncbi:MAG: chemotaxis protein CheW [Candidatus Omnitrophota bacterium]|jgi:purine-binding chemotaxis protein CheW|nr:chemotaxis protein CheW [Candidatus Omnitrophota bacterium]
MPEQKKDASHAKEVQLVIFRLAKEEFGLDISHVREIIRLQDITPMPKSPEFIEGVINLRGQIIAVMDLVKKFGLKKADRTEKTRIIVSELKENTLGLIVDEVPEVLRISEQDIDPTPEMIESQVNSDFIKGVGKLQDRLVILLNVDKILSREEVKQVKEAAK